MVFGREVSFNSSGSVVVKGVPAVQDSANTADSSMNVGLSSLINRLICSLGEYG